MYLIIVDYNKKKYQPFPSVIYTPEIEDFVIENLNRINEKLDVMLDCNWTNGVKLGDLHADNFELEQDLYEKHVAKFNNNLNEDEEQINCLSEIVINDLNYEVFSRLSLEQREEYLKTFSPDSDIILGKKYQLKIREIFENFLFHWGNIPEIIEEINFIKDTSNNKFSKFTDEFIFTLNYFLEIGEEEAVKRIEIVIFIKTFLLVGESVSFMVSVDDTTYEFSSENILEPKTFTLLKHIPNNILKAAIEEGEFKVYHRGFINRVLYQKSIIAFIIGKDFYSIYKLRVNVIKEAVLIIDLLKSFCEKFTPFILNLKNDGTIYGNNFSYEYLRLAKAYFKIKDFKKSIYWIDEFLMIIEKVDCVLPVNLSDFTDLKSKCLLKQDPIKNQLEHKREINPNKFKSFSDARDFVRSLNLKSEKEWKEYKKLGTKPIDIPAKPEDVYKGKGWKGYVDWLGYIMESKSNFLSYDEAKIFVHKLELSTENEWREFKKLNLIPENIPRKPEKTYKGKGWKGFRDWLGY